MTKTRQERDLVDVCELFEFLDKRNPSSDNSSLRSIATGINGDSKVNADVARYVGNDI